MNKKDLLKQRAEKYVRRARESNPNKPIFRIDEKDKVTKDDPQVKKILESIAN
jgi:Ni2+-binding GTPase involved in maturation of urease and hydrogenase